MVNFLISGDMNDLMRVRLGLSERQPLVVMKGSGGAAEVVSESLNYFKTKASFYYFCLTGMSHTLVAQFLELLENYQQAEEYRFDKFGGDDDDDEVTVTKREMKAILKRFKSTDVNNILQKAGIKIVRDLRKVSRILKLIDYKVSCTEIGIF